MQKSPANRYSLVLLKPHNIIRFGHICPHKLLIIIIFLASCATQEPFINTTVSDWQDHRPDNSAELIYQVYLMGDSRRVYESKDMTELIDSKLSQAGENSAVVFLGDNVQFLGLPDSTHRQWEVALKSIDAHMDLLHDFEGEVFFIPGNHDWALGGKDGLNRVKNQRKYIEKNLDKKNVFLPKKGRPGPVEIKLTKDIVLIIFDSQWWFHEHAKSYAGILDEADIFVQIEDIVSRNRDKKIIFACHHPLYSVGNHGGHFPGSSILFPLVDVHPALWIPLPGFLYTGYRKYLGMGQDLANPHYKLMNEALLETFEGHSDIIFAAGHEHNLQYVEKEGIHHIVSGAAGKASYAAQSPKTDYAQMQLGFARLGYYSNGDVWLEFFTVAEGLSFRKKLYNKPIFDKDRIKEYLSDIDYSDSSLVTHPNGEKFQAGNFKKVFFGDNYREEWMIPVEVPVFDFKQKGGLEIVQKGGNGQTKSLRLENDKKQQWVLRSVDKDPSKVIPEVVKMQLAIDVVQDQMSASLPWAALSVPPLADAAQIYHTNPEIVYLTKDPRLGAYRDDVWEGLYLFEERPNGNRKDVESFGRSKDIVGTPDMFDDFEDDHDNQMDQDHFLRSRLFDVFISDWDRHEDQWRWAKFDKKGDKVLYRAVPRDRDQTFFLNEGVFPWISSRKFALWINQGLDYEVDDMEALISQGRWLDRRFLNELDKEDWIRTAESMQTAFTDELISAAIHDMPPQIYAVRGEETVAKLKSRRDQLPAIAEEYYSIISKKVDIVGSDKREQFLVDRLNSDETEVKVWSLNKEGKKKDKIYDRTFKHSETKEIRLYGLGGKDEFDVEGEAERGIKVRIVGGSGKDDIKEKSEVSSPGKHTLIYDTRSKNDIEFGTEARNRTSNIPERNAYNYYAFNYNKFIPLAYFGFNSDEALVLGAGFKYTTHGFQKTPYATDHSLGARYATATNALELQYKGLYRSVFGKFDLNLNFIIRDPRYSHNYFGLGNETSQSTEDKDYNRVRIGQLHFLPEISRSFERSTFSAGVFYQHFNVEDTEGRYISDIPANGLDPDIFNTQRFAGIRLRYEVDTRNNKVLPTRGTYWNTYSLFNYSLLENAHTYNQVATDLRFFLSFKEPQRLVLAFRFGGAINIGDYEFFQAANVGGNSNLRGHRSNRYAGDASAYQNTELRFKLFNYSTYFAKGEFGILGFNDVGRVWLEGEDSNVWHHGYGGGLWLSPFGLAVLNASYEWSKDEPSGLFALRFRFHF